MDYFFGINIPALRCKRCNIIIADFDLENIARAETPRGFLKKCVLTVEQSRRKSNQNKTAQKTTVSTYLSKKFSEIAKEYKLNLSTERRFLVDGAGFEPAASTMPTWRSFQTDLPAHCS